MAQELRELNEERKNMTDTEAKKAIEMVEGTDLYEDNVLVVYLPECHESVAGIIAGRLRDISTSRRLSLPMRRTAQRVRGARLKAIICLKKSQNARNC